MTLQEETAYDAEVQQYCDSNKVKDGDKRVIAEYKVTLGNGETIIVPNVEVFLYYCQQDDGTFKWEEAIDMVWGRNIENAVRAKYPNYYSKWENKGEEFKVNLPVWHVGEYDLKKGDVVIVIERMPGMVRIINTYFKQPYLASEFDFKTHCTPRRQKTN